MYLITIAQGAMRIALEREEGRNFANMVSLLLDEINAQQPEELKNWNNANDAMK